MIDGAERPRSEATLAGGALTIVLAGIALGAGFNHLGLRAGAWGVPWIAEDRLAELPAVASAEPASVDRDRGGYGASDDPMAVGGGSGAGVPEIPDLERPVQIHLEAVKQLFDAGAALFVDAREPHEYAAGHIPGALNLTYDEASAEPERLAALDARGRAIVVYCGGGACELSLDLAWDLIHAGQRRVAVYMGGFPDWNGAGYPVGAGAPTGS